MESPEINNHRKENNYFDSPISIKMKFPKRGNHVGVATL